MVEKETPALFLPWIRELGIANCKKGIGETQRRAKKEVSEPSKKPKPQRFKILKSQRSLRLVGARAHFPHEGKALPPRPKSNIPPNFRCQTHNRGSFSNHPPKKHATTVTLRRWAFEYHRSTSGASYASRKFRPV